MYCPELHFSEFTSAVADMKNSVAVRYFFSFTFFLLDKNMLLCVFWIMCSSVDSCLKVLPVGCNLLEMDRIRTSQTI